MHEKKTKYRVIIPLIAAIVFLGAVIFFISSNYPAPDLSFTEKITVIYTPHDEYLKFEITDSNDIKEIIKACTENAKKGDGSCPFDIVRLIFEGRNKKVTLLPASDDCGVIKFGDIDYDKYYLIGDENKAKLISILRKYGASFDYLER